MSRNPCPACGAQVMTVRGFLWRGWQAGGTCPACDAELQRVAWASALNLACRYWKFLWVPGVFVGALYTRELTALQRDLGLTPRLIVTVAVPAAVSLAAGFLLACAAACVLVRASVWRLDAGVPQSAGGELADPLRPFDPFARLDPIARLEHLVPVATPRTVSSQPEPAERARIPRMLVILGTGMVTTAAAIATALIGYRVNGEFSPKLTGGVALAVGVGLLAAADRWGLLAPPASPGNVLFSDRPDEASPAGRASASRQGPNTEGPRTGAPQP